MRLKASAWITPDPNGNGGVILLSLSASDIATLQSYDGNIMGVAYEIRRHGDSSYSDKAFLFLGKGIGAALAGLGLDKPIKFAALAVKNNDGTFGYAFDHDTREEAVERAVAECTKRGGEICDTKLVLSGPACLHRLSFRTGQQCLWLGLFQGSGRCDFTGGRGMRITQ